MKAQLDVGYRFFNRVARIMMDDKTYPPNAMQSIASVSTSYWPPVTDNQAIGMGQAIDAAAI